MAFKSFLLDITVRVLIQYEYGFPPDILVGERQGIAIEQLFGNFLPNSHITQALCSEYITYFNAHRGFLPGGGKKDTPELIPSRKGN